MVHIRIIRGRSYKYTTRWNPTRGIVENVYLGAVNPIRKGVKHKKKEPVRILSAKERISQAEQRQKEIRKATLKQLGYTSV